jgi:hypothetical protein
MALAAIDRRKVMAQLSREFVWTGLTKPDIQAAVGAIDDYFDANAAAINAALPQPFRGTASADQKALIVALVAARRGGYLKTKDD